MSMKKAVIIKQNYSLKLLNTFGIEAEANYFALVQNTKELIELLSNPQISKMPKLILGEGSNILFTKNYVGIVIKNTIKGILLLKEDDDYVWVQAGAGENWHDFVMYCIQHGYGGAENLSLIPGTVGAAPIQNIGAYGAELKDIFYELEAINLQNGSIRVFTNKECQFAYRDSIFKKSLKHQFAITSVIFRLYKKPKLNVNYAALKEALKPNKSESINIKMISDAVIKIRRNKLPDPKILGNAGSFFKNPIITQSHFMKLQKKFSAIPHFIQQDDSIKVNAAWLIEQCGWKGKQFGNVGVYGKQALVLVNYGKGTGSDVLELATKIQNSVLDQFEILLEPEVLLI